MKILLMGHPNVGKSVVFNRLTGANVAESNYPGTTVDFEKGQVLIDHQNVDLIDVPGTFSLEPKDRAEEVAVKILKENKDATVVCVIDASKIERGLYLALEIIEKGYPLVIALNMWDVAQDKNIAIDSQKLSKILGISVVPTVAISGKGISSLLKEIKYATPVDIIQVKQNLKEGS
jgi:ferrous iron transport protein B